MGLFDGIGKKVTGAGQKAVQKTQELSEVARINSLISQNETKINNTYFQIGKLFVSIHGGDCGSDFTGMVATVMELEQQNTAYRKQIQDIKGVQRCVNCGAEIPKGVAFCSSCGTAIPKTESLRNFDDYVECPGCGSRVKKGMRFCTSCGRALVQPNVIHPAANRLAKAPDTMPPTGKICPQCGAKLDEDAEFCTECGKALVQPAADVFAMTPDITLSAEKICPQCGAKLDEDAEFCTECGTEL